MSYTDLGTAFSPDDRKEEPLPADLVPRLAIRAIESRSTSLPNLRKLLEAAIAHKMTDVAQIAEELGPKAAEVAKGSRNPDPVTYRAVMKFVANLQVA